MTASHSTLRSRRSFLPALYWGRGESPTARHPSAGLVVAAAVLFGLAGDADLDATSGRIREAGAASIDFDDWRGWRR